MTGNHPVIDTDTAPCEIVGNKPAMVPLVPRSARTVDLAIAERKQGPILLRRDVQLAAGTPTREPPRSTTIADKTSTAMPGASWSRSSSEAEGLSPRVGTPAGERAPTHSQAVATASAAQISLIRAPLSTPIRSISTATDTDSTESRLTALLRPIGSSPGSSTTSLGKPRIVVVQGATSARRRRGMAASRDNTTTGRRPICGGSHHHTSPRRGRSFTLRLRHCGTSPDRPTRPLRRWGGRRTPPRMPHQLPWLDDARAARPEHRRSTRNLTCRREIGGRWLADLHRRWC
jgi:hypothetical protein